MARWEDVPEDAWERIFFLLGSYLDRARCLAVCRDWRRLGARPPLLPCVLAASADQGLSTVFDVVVGETHLVPNAPSFHGRRVIGSFVGGRIALAFTVPNPTLYGIMDLSTGAVSQTLPDRLRLPDSAHLQSVAIQAITGGRGLFAATALGDTALIFWRAGMEAWCPPLPAPVPGVEDEDDAQGVWPLWRMMLPDSPIDDVYYSEAFDSFFVLSIRQDLWRYIPVRLQDGGLAFKRDLYIVGADLSGARAARYLCPVYDALLMARRVRLPRQGTSELEVFAVHTAPEGSPDGAPRISWQRLSRPPGMLMFLGRGHSKVYRSVLTKPSFIFFLDDRDGYRRLTTTYRCADNGRYCFDTQVIERLLPTGPPSHLSNFVWVLPSRGHA